MSETFQVGEIAELRNVPAPFDNVNGEEVTILSPLSTRTVVYIDGSREDQKVHLIEFRGISKSPRGLPIGVPLHYLKKKKNPPDAKEQDRNTPVSWGDVAWQPKVTEVA